MVKSLNKTEMIIVFLSFEVGINFVQVSSFTSFTCERIQEKHIGRKIVFLKKLPNLEGAGVGKIILFYGNPSLRTAQRASGDHGTLPSALCKIHLHKMNILLKIGV